MSQQLLEQIQADEFLGCIGKQFDVSLDENGDAIAQLILESVDKVGRPFSPEARIPFSLAFTGTTDAPLDQGTYWFKRSDFGVQAIFIVPIGQSGNSRTYEAIFS